MICRLFEFEADVNRVDSSNLKRVGDCCHCDSACDRCEILNISKTKAKFSWTIAKRLTFPADYKFDYEVAIKLIHPSNEDFWIVKRKDEKSKYSVICSKFEKVMELFSEINSCIREDLNYDGYDIVEEDFG